MYPTVFLQANTVQPTSALGKLTSLRERRAAELATFFYYSNAHIIGNYHLREPQEEAYIALKRYFRRPHKSPAMIEIPTGCGKSGIICIAPFGIAKGRVLVVAPNLTVRDTILQAFAGYKGTPFQNSKNFYLKCHVLKEPTALPKVVVLERNRTNLEDCLRADVVIANIQQLVGWIDQFDEKFFDFILVDEAHHVPADSWRRVMEAFPQAKKLYLTATPFRSDHQPIQAKPIYKYCLSRAIKNDYIKNIIRLDAVASKLTFTVEGQMREFSLDEIQEHCEEFWFSKGVALSEICNRTIVTNSIALLNEKRRTGVCHQMIATACSIRHALQLVELFQVGGLQTTYVVSQGMSREEREHRLKAFEAGHYDCIVQVGILGEGYDHPNVSVAAVFRPYRSLSPYAQFIGRTLRRLENGCHQDNLAHIVGHVGLNLDPLWQEFKKETWKPKSGYFPDPFTLRETTTDSTETEETELPAIINQEILGLSIDCFLPTEEMATSYQEIALGEISKILQTLGPQIAYTNHEKEPITGGNDGMQSRASFSQLEQRPDLERDRLRQRLNQEVRRATGFILYELGFLEEGKLVQLLGDSGELTNYEVIIRALNRDLNHAMSKEESHSHRNDWTLEELQSALSQIRMLRDRLLFKIRLVTGARQVKERLF